MSNDEIKKQKGEYWSKPGAGEQYHKNVSSTSASNQVKNLVETEIVLQNSEGLVLDAGTGSGRFARALARKGLPVVALDYSNEMLDINKKIAAEEGLFGIEYVQGDVENLKFDDSSFDTVVSITVVRHFPQWEAILKEYARVLKPGGKLIFEMCSADHIDLANRIWPRFGVKHSDGSFYYYEAEVSFDYLRSYLDLIGIDVNQRISYDFLNNNCILKIFTINNFLYKGVMKILNAALSVWPIPNVLKWLELNVLSKLPASSSYNYMVVCEKR